MLGLDYAEKNYPFIDKDRECALGASYGGYAINWIEGHTDRFKCLVSHDGMFNTAVGVRNDGRAVVQRVGVQRHAVDESRALPQVVAAHVRHRTSRRRCWSSTASSTTGSTCRKASSSSPPLQRLKVPSKMLYFPDEGHWVLKPQNSRLW